MNTETPLPPSAYGPEEIKRHYHNFDVEQGRYRFILEELKPQSKVLEIGCSIGRYCDYFKSCGHEPVGVDISPYVIDEAKKLFPELEFHCIDGAELHDAFDAHQFDAVVASEVIEHVLYPQEFLKSILKLLKPEGRLLLTTQNSNGIQYRLQMLFGQFRWDPTHLRLYSRPELEEEIRQGGFEIEKMKGIPINPKGPHQLTRQFAYWSAKAIQNFCWTWGVVARPKG